MIVAIQPRPGMAIRFACPSVARMEWCVRPAFFKR